MSRAVEAELVLEVSPRRTLKAFLDPVDLHGWWEVERALVDPRIGGLYTLAWGATGQGFRYASTGIVGHYEPARVLGITHSTYFGPARPILGPM